jgi:hypothetical protein
MKAKDDQKKHLSAKERIDKIKSVVPPVAARFKKPTLQQQTDEALENVPRITNETVAEHREKVLAGGRKFKYPVGTFVHKPEDIYNKLQEAVYKNVPTVEMDNHEPSEA